MAMPTHIVAVGGIVEDEQGNIEIIMTGEGTAATFFWLLKYRTE
jgi:hypothetical protein